MGITKEVIITATNGESIKVPMYRESDREVTTLVIDGVKYHFERMKSEQFIADYQVDDDPDYEPETDVDGCCYMLAPFSR